MFRSRAERKVADAGYDPARLPPGQYLTEKWPVLHYGGVPRIKLAVKRSLDRFLLVASVAFSSPLRVVCSLVCVRVS